jgi:purine-nucleoside/S-methyl-5'-thioadenosine phosphorylase / adenosine deaminase
VSARALMCELPGRGRAVFTARVDGNMSSMSGTGAEHGTEARERLRARIGVPRTARARQVHGAVVGRVHSAHREPDASDGDADGQATAIAGIGMLVLAADCLPVALGSSRAVAMLHAGWRGLGAGVLEAGVLALQEVGGAAEIVAVIGPGAGACCYEVGPDVRAALGGAHGEGGRIDLRAIARERLLAAGVEHVRDISACTICDERFFSHRREGVLAGRQAGVAWLS